MRPMPWRAIATMLVIWFFLIGGSCKGPSREQSVSSASGFRIFVTADPNTIRIAVGTATIGGCSVITAKVFNTNGQLVDGALVTFTKTLGVFTPPGTTDTFDAVTATTVNGIANAVLCAQTQAGTSVVTGRVEDASGTAIVTFF